jgi:hypothetical protein
MKILLILLFPFVAFAETPNTNSMAQADQYNEHVIAPLITAAVKKGKKTIFISQVDQNKCSLECVNLLIAAYKAQGYHYSSVMNELTDQVSLSLAWFK